MLDGSLTIDIADDGHGIDEGVRAGVGLTAMRERAEELGGAFQIESMPNDGTRIVARLPVETTS
jgi:two-component system NarL family sensor kinase